MKSQLKIGVILSYVNLFASVIVSLVFTPFIIKSLGDSQYGLYTMVSSLVGYLGLLNFGFSSSYIRYYSKYKKEEDNNSIYKLNGMFLVVFTIISIAVIVVGFSLIPNLSSIIGDKIQGQDLETAKSLFLILVLNLAIPLLTTVFNMAVIANEKFIFLKFITLVKTIINPIIMFPILILGYQSIGMSLVTLTITLVFEFIIMMYSFRVLGIAFIFNKFDYKLIREMLIFSSFIFINMITDQVNWNIDKILLGRYIGTASVAIYSIASQINTYFIMVSTQFSGVFTPRVNRLVANGDNESVYALFTKVGRIQFIVLVLILLGFYTFGLEFIQLWVGSSYNDAYYIVLILITTVFFPSIQNTGIEIQRAKNMHKFRSIVYFIIAIANVLFSIQLIKLFGPIGAALGTGIALIVGNVFLMNWYYHNFIGLDMIKFWKNIIKLSRGAVLPLIFAIFIKNVIVFDGIFCYSLFIIIFVSVYAVSMWLFGFNSSEKDLVIIPINCVVSKFKKIT